MRTHWRWLTFSALFGWLVFGMLLAPAANATGNCGDRNDFGRGSPLRVVGLTADQKLVTFRECSPRKLKLIGPVRGLGGQDGTLVGIDYRVQDGELYGVGNAGGVYRLDTATGDATFVSQLSVPLDGTLFGVDFNPAADRLRIVSDTGQNLRHNVSSGGTTLVDGALNNQGPVATGVSGAAYTNNDADANTGTTLFDLDATLDQAVIQSPPNAGVLTPTGKLGVDAAASTGFDIQTTLKGGSAQQNRAFAVLAVNGVPGFYRVNLLTGRATLIGALGADVRDIALPLDQ
jgi:hypothetical protein